MKVSDVKVFTIKEVDGAGFIVQDDKYPSLISTLGVDAESLKRNLLSQLEAVYKFIEIYGEKYLAQPRSEEAR